MRRDDRVTALPERHPGIRARRSLRSGAVAATRGLTMGTPEFAWKPWGFEQLFCTGEYAVKLLHVRAGEGLSLESHVARTETLMVHRGLAQILVGNESRLYS